VEEEALNISLIKSRWRGALYTEREKPWKEVRPPSTTE